ncbi:hypothetical protein [Vibrio algarum]|uniref:Sulfotransferase family protein n=1 Tax=Vibrio algarum TaxID=3020714 RepID=A0ABT4YQ73_9VIBR|nr:hypothetical protein [Vibrio sp. KJ40-1]MDB1123710.1 hypothetical protein [Vibrio sp. KJ40-1]
MINEVVKNPSVLVPKKHIFLISHMRANTTLLGHVFGSHQDVSGYYEHHIGYFSWKSLVRQKLKFSKENPNEPVTSVYFDKVLHSSRIFNDYVIKSKNTRFLFMLRKPERTIKSIVALYMRVEPTNDYVSISYAADYYIERVKQIGELAKRCSQNGKFYYLDSEVITSEKDSALETLSHWYGLHPSLTSEYRSFELTGKRKYGDSSDNIKTGKINASTNAYQDIVIDKKLLDKCNEIYDTVRREIIDLAEDSMLEK